MTSELIAKESEDSPLILSPTLKVSWDRILRVFVVLSQLWIVPVLVPETISSPGIKSFVTRSISNVGKYFSGVIIPEDLIRSTLPGSSPAFKSSVRLYETVPIPPMFGVTEVRVNNLYP